MSVTDSLRSYLLYVSLRPLQFSPAGGDERRRNEATDLAFILKTSAIRLLFPVSSTTSHERLFALFHSEEARRKSPSALWLRTTDGDVLLSMNSLEPAWIKPLGSTPETLCVPKRLSNGNCFLWENSLKPIHVNYKTWIMVCFSISSGLIFPLHHFLLMHKPPLRDCGAEIRKAGGYDGLIQEKHSPANYSNRYLLLAFRCSLRVNAQSATPLRSERRRSRNSTTTSKQGNKQTAMFSH